MRLKRFQLPKGCDITSIVLRETCGADEEQAAQRADARGNKPGQILEELLRCSIVKINDASVEYPYLGLKKWNTKTRNSVLTFFNDMNSVDEEELKSFREGAEDMGEWVPPGASTAPSSSGNG